tara:strand:- start:910 stop:1212 length:303 start_codon:yes stop_codon:yes gene_type:complete
MNNFVFEELDKNRNKFNDFDLDDLLEGQFENFVPWHDLFVKYCSDKKVEVNLKESETLRGVKAHLGLQLFGDNIFNRIKNQHDLFLNTAIKALDSLSKVD